MEANNFKSDDVLYAGLSKISTKQIIPSLQRPYTWDKKNINKLWRDIIENESPYFVGTIVLVAGEGSSSRDEVIDGQQRITTISLTLLALRDYIAESKPSDYKEISHDLRDLLFQPQFDQDPIPRLQFLDNKSNEIYVSLLASAENIGKSSFDLSDIERKFFDNYSEIKRLINESIVSNVVSVEDIFTKVKGLEIVIIRCASKTSGYKLFEGLNATAVPLAGVDLIKNALFMKLSVSSSRLTPAQEDWQLLESKFEDSRKLFKDFIRHQWLSSVGYVNHSRLFEEFERLYIRGGTEEQTYTYIKELLADADIYLALRYAKIENLDHLPAQRFERGEIKEILEFLKFLNVDQVYPILLHVYKNKPKDFKKYLIRLAAFQFIFKFLPGSPSIVEKYFAQFCRRDIGSEKLFEELRKLCVKQEDQFSESFLSKTKYREGRSGDLQFVLQKYLYANSAVKSHKKPTIEHLIPQRPNLKYKKILLEKFEGGSEFREYLQKVGNLTILEKSENRAMENNPFDEKKDFYSEDMFEENKNILNYAFGIDPKSAIDERGQYIAKRVYHLFIQALEKGKF